jgi:ribonuclease D
VSGPQPADEAAPDGPGAPLLVEPADGVPEPIMRPAQLAELAARFAAGTGPVAVDAERASGYRYSQRAYLVQLRRTGSGTALVDPIALPDLSALDAALADAEWVLHSAGQDLTCLAEVGLRPPRLFDTEVAGRLLGQERVALGTMIEERLGVRLEKGHSAADWSTRPLPREWLAYAALDVELLVPLRNVLAVELEAAGKLDWARQEFEWIRTSEHVVARVDPWRRTSGIHRARGPRQLAVVRALWHARDRYAAQRDVAPGRVLPDAAIVEAASAEPVSREALGRLPVFRGPRQRRQLARWWAAVEQAQQLPPAELPPVTSIGTDPTPPASRWRERDPAAADRLARCRTAVAELATGHSVLPQSLLASDVVRRLAWSPPTPATPTAVATDLAGYGARPWQVELCAPALATALTEVPLTEETT